MPKEPILRIKNLKVYFKTDEGTAKAVDNINFCLYKGETLGIVGESGCGKSVTSLSVMKLVPSPPGFIEGGKIFFKGSNIKNGHDLCLAGYALYSPATQMIIAKTLVAHSRYIIREGSLLSGRFRTAHASTRFQNHKRSPKQQ